MRARSCSGKILALLRLVTGASFTARQLYLPEIDYLLSASLSFFLKPHSLICRVFFRKEFRLASIVASFFVLFVPHLAA